MTKTTRCSIGATMLMSVLLVSGCGKKPAEPTNTTPPTDGTTLPPPGPERPALTTAECEAKSGRVIGDIGDGATRRPDYTCEGGQPPLGDIRAAEGEPIATEGSVCCPAPA